MKILLAEDDSNITVILQLVLERMGGHQVMAVTDGAQAFEKATQETFDLILLDGMMPKMSGLQVLHALEEKSPDHAPVIFLSAKTDTREIAEVLNLGAGHIPKPFDPQHICHQIDLLYPKLKRGRQAA